VHESNATVPLRGLKRTTGFAASLLAAWCQILLLATISLAPLELGTGPAGHFPICHADRETQPAKQKPDQPVPVHDCAQCVLCLSQASPLAILSPAPMLPQRRTLVIVRLDAAHPRAPPVRLVFAAQPRGPPTLI
jgi:hypothetical protein